MSVVKQVNLVLRLVALAALALALTDPSLEPGTHKSLYSPPTPRVAVSQGRAPKYLRSRIQHDSKSISTWSLVRVIVSGDVELNPGPAGAQAAPPAGVNQRHRAEPLTCIAQNVRSLKNKLGSLRALSPVLQKYDIIALTETWLKPHVSDSELQHGFDGHVWFRHDRAGDVMGGGVACALRSSLMPTRRPELESGEILVIDLMSCCPAVTVIAAYRPPDDDKSLEKIVNVFNAVCATERPVLVVGDFNLPEIDWCRPYDYPLLLRTSSRAMTFVDHAAQCGLGQHVRRPTRGDNILDLALTNMSVSQCEVDEGFFDSDHRQITVTCLVSRLPPPRVTRSTALNYRRADFPALRESLRLLPWDVLDSMDVDDAVDLFYQWTEAAVADHIPRVSLRSKYPPWFDGDVKRALHDKEVAHRRKKLSPTSENTADFRLKRSVFKTTVFTKYREYILHIIDDFHSNSKRFWSLLKSAKASGRTAPVLKIDGRIVTDDCERAECFNRVFASKFSDPTVDRLPDVVSHDVDMLSEFSVTHEAVCNLLRSQNVHKTCGPDGLSARILKECAEEFSTPLSKICLLSFKQGKFPTAWKRAHITPVHKKGDRKNPHNYRPISLLPICSKILERVTCDQLMRHVSPVISPAQHGFLPRRSCNTNLACLVKQIWDSIADGLQTDVIYTDFSSAFTSVNHSLLLHKLHRSYHLSGAALRWFESYLCGREQCVVLNGKTSGWVPVGSGVPEGSICGPILFVLFCDDVHMHISSPCLMYADDLKLCKRIRSLDDAVALQTDLDNLCEWSDVWKLKLNPSKCKVITYTLRKNPVLASYSINGIVLDRVSEMRDLGVVLDSKLTFASHVDDVVGRANRALGTYLRSLQTSRVSAGRRLRPAPLITAFNSHVRSILEYGSIIWSGAAKSHTVRLERVQHKFLIWLAVNSNRPSASLDYAHLLKHFQVLRISDRLAKHDFMFLHGVFSGRFDSADILDMFGLAVSARATRSRPILHVPIARVETIKNGMLCRLPRQANLLYAKVPSADLFGNRCAFQKCVTMFISSV